eukprot:gene42760-56842_t
MEAGRAMGLPDRTLIWRYLTLNCISTIFVFLTLRFGGAEVTDTNMTLSDDHKTAELKVPFTEMLDGTAKLPDELYAVVKANYKHSTPTEIDIALSFLDHGRGLEPPKQQTAGAAGVDLLAALGATETVTLEPGKRAMVPCGIAIALPIGFEAQVRPRSGLAAKHGVTVLNSPGTIDADYRGEIKVILINHGDSDFTIRRGDRIAQMVVARRSMQRNGVLAASARLAASCLALLTLAVVPALAGDRALIDFIGYSEDGQYFAFEEYGIGDGSGAPYSHIFIVDLAADAWGDGAGSAIYTNTGRFFYGGVQVNGGPVETSAPSLFDNPAARPHGMRHATTPHRDALLRDIGLRAGQL